MRVDVSYKYTEKSEFIDDVLDRNLERIAKRIKMFRRDDPIHVSVHLEKNPHRSQYFCRTQVYLPARVIKAQAQAVKPEQAINGTFSALARQLTKVKYRVEKHLKRNQRRCSVSDRVDNIEEE